MFDHDRTPRGFRQVWAQTRPTRHYPHRLGTVSLIALTAVLAAPGAQGGTLASNALPHGATVASGSAAIRTSGAAMTVTQGSSKAIVNWQGFDVGSGAQVTFQQPNASSVILNRVTGAGGSAIEGKINANGQVYIVNPNGVLFGKGAQVNVGGLVASTHNLSDANFQAGNRTFEKDGATGSVVNQGTITTPQGGSVALIANTVKNEGTITAPGGDVVLAAGSKVVLNAGANGHLKIAVDADTVNALVSNGGIVAADGGQVVMTAQATGQAVSSAVANTGTVQARTIGTKNGHIELLADMNIGTAQVGGTLDASAPTSGDGGFIETSAAKVTVAKAAKVTTLAAHGTTGNWLIDPNDFTVASGGDITGAALADELSTSNVTLQSSDGASSGNGDITVADTVTLGGRSDAVLTLVAERNVTIDPAGSIDMNGGTLNLIADSGGTGIGTVSSSGHIENATVNAYYHPSTDYGAFPALALSGTSALHPYILISNVGQLQRISENLGGNYVVNADIDASGTNFVPIGNVGMPFTGTFNGGTLAIDAASRVTIGSSSHVIDGLTINQPSTSYIGLFGVSSGTISNIGLTNVAIAGASYVGALVGKQAGGTISNASSSGTVSTVSSYAGGLIGSQDGGTLTSSYSATDMTGIAYVGGLVGAAHGGISDSYAVGSVTGTTYAGGLVGRLADDGSLSDVYSSGAVAGTGNTGGLIGLRDGTSPGAAVTHAYWDADTSKRASAVGNGSSSGIVQLLSSTGTSAFAQSSYAGFDFGSTWWSIDGFTRPVLRSEYSTTIHTPHQLQMMAMDVGASYTLAADLDMSATASNAADMWNLVDHDFLGYGFVPVGCSGCSYSASPFTGTFDGQGHAVDGLSLLVHNPGAGGLFGYTSGATISNVTLSNVAVTVTGRGGAVVGVAENSTLSNVHVTGTVTGSEVGGLVGWLDSSTITGSSSAATVSGPSEVGGLAGRIYSGGGSISDSYATGTVTSDGGYAGGLVGNVISGYSLALTDVYASGAVSGAAATSGGLVGGVGGAVNVGTGVYWDSHATGQASAFATGLAVSAAAQDVASAPLSQGTYGDLDFSGSSSTWVIFDGETRPMLRGEYSTGIYTPHQLQLMTLDPAAHYTLGADLDMTATSGTGEVWGAAGFLPVGNSGTAFTGTFDGQGHTLTGLTIDRPTTDDVSLFGYASGAAISNLTLSGGSVTGGTNVGALVGYLSGGTVTSASSSAAVTSTGGFAEAGGLVGTDDGGAITRSSSSGTVSAAGYDVGGLVGYLINGGLISQSFAVGDVTGQRDDVGGLVGANGYYGSSLGGTITQSYTAGTVTGSSGGAIGGLVGHNDGAISDSYAVGQVIGLAGTSNIGGLVGVNFLSGTIVNAYSTSYVTGPSQVGGFVGYNNNDASAITGSYWDTETSGRSVGISGGGGGATGKTTAQLQGALPSGFDNAIWGTGTNLYPYFGWNYATTPVAVSGFAYSDFGTVVLAGVTVAAVSGGNATGSASSGANGYYYILSAAGTLANTGVLTYLDGGANQGAAFSDVAGVNGVQNVSVYGSAAHLIAGDVSLTATQTNYAATIGSYADSDLSFLSASNFAALTTGGAGVVLDAAGDYLLNTDLQSGGALILNSGGTFGVSGAVHLNATGDMVIGANLAWTDTSSLTVMAGGSLNLAGAVTAPNGEFDLLLGGTVSPAGAFDVDIFSLTGGTWNQINGTLPSFSATDFRVATNATFLRVMGGDGSTATPYQIVDVYGLQGLASNSLLAKSFVLAQDIDASGTANWNSGEGFLPIGSLTPFSGAFDGQGHTITGLTIDRPTTDFVGLFGRLSGTVRNVGLVDNTITGASSVGGLVGQNFHSVHNAFATGIVLSNASQAGGLIGVNLGTVTDTYATGPVTGIQYVGGLIGVNEGTVGSSYATGLVTGSGAVGGLIGDNILPLVTGSFWNVTTTGQMLGDGGGGSTAGMTGLTTAQMTDLANYTAAGWDIDDAGGTGKTWRIYAGYTAPLLRSFMTGLTVTGGNGEKTYDGSTTTSAVGTLTYGIGGVDMALIQGSAVYTADSANAGSYSGSHLSLGGLYSGQFGYDITTVAGALTIDKRALTITAAGVDKTYDGTTAAAVTYGDDRVTGDDLTIGGGTAAFGDRNAGDGKTITVNGITVSGADAGNYTWNTVATAKADIFKRALTITAAGLDKTYDGTTAATVTYGDDRVTGDSLSVSGSAAFGDKNAGDGKVITVNGIVVGGADAGNYTWNTTATTRADIAKRALTVTAAGIGKTYDSTTAATVTYGDDRVAGDDLTVGGGSATFDDRNAGDGKVITVNGIVVSGADAGNYTWNTVATTHADIDKRALTIMAAGVDKTYDGTTAATVTYGDDRVAGDDLTVGGGSATFDDRNAGDGEVITVNGIVVSGADAGNYTWNSTATTHADIDKRALTVTANNATRSGADANPTLTYTVSGGGLARGDSQSAVFCGALAATDTRAAGQYAITQGTLAVNSNYRIARFNPGVLTVSADTPPITPVAPPIPAAVSGGYVSHAVAVSTGDATAKLAANSQTVTGAGGNVSHMTVAADFVRMP